MANKVLKNSILSLFLIGNLISNAQKNYVVVKPIAGDGVYSLLERYHLITQKINIDSFYSINKMEKEAPLIKGKKYYLPIEIKPFDGKTIRSSLSFNNFQQALEIQKYNELMVKDDLKNENYKTDLKLWIPIHLLPKNGISDVNSNYETKFEIYPIFGEKHQKVKITDNLLEGRVYYLISGHGGPDPGAMCKYQGKYISEDEYAYDVTLRLARNLLSHSATVYIIVRDKNDGIRDDNILNIDYDEYYYGNYKIERNQIKRLKKRTSIINYLYEENKRKGVKYQRAIAIHVDSRYEDKKIDVFFYHYPGSTIGKSLAEKIFNRIKKEYAEHQKTREYTGEIKSRDLFLLRESKPVAVYIELGNITNSFDQKRLFIPDNRQALANWIALGLIEDIKP